MKQIFFAFLIALSFTAYSQKEPPGLIYSCEKKINGNAQYEIFNSTGQKIIDHRVDWAYSNTWTWLFIMDAKSRLKTIYNYHGQKLGIDSIEESQSTYLNLNRVGLKRNGKWGFYDRQGKLKIPHLYDEISHFNNNIAAVRLDKEKFLIDTNGLKLSMRYDPNNEDYTFDDMDIAIGMGGDFHYPDFKKITEKGKVGLLDVVNNKIIIPVEYDELVDIKDNLKLITGGKNGKYGLLAFGGQIVIPFEYERVFVLNDYF
jgi:hypothetical protein